MHPHRETLSRRTFVGQTVGAAAVLALPDASQATEIAPSAEQFVQANVLRLLALMANTTAPTERQRLDLSALLESFIAFDRVGLFVLGRYAGHARQNPALRDAWISAFKDYAVASYEIRLNRFRGGLHRVTGSATRLPNQDVIVSSQFYGGALTEPVDFGWRVVRSADVWTVFDLQVRLEGGQIWLAQQQQAEILSELDRNNGDLADLTTQVARTTARIRSTVRGMH
ncbi:MAG: ABC transporter substrate-binding protein [Proteobacteria bacterium]|nr:ABC transporter substrate-binding protein [Pseudomonadota bacterium]